MFPFGVISKCRMWFNAEPFSAGVEYER